MQISITGYYNILKKQIDKYMVWEVGSREIIHNDIKD